jgi:hypothetical protein
VKRRLIAIGDLHGDVHRLVRILERQEVLMKGTRKWARSSGTVDVVLLGDYVDWRGEPLEGQTSTWERGVADLLDLIVDLHGQARAISSSSQHNKSRFFCLLGNHDKMMLDAWRYLRELPEGRRAAVAASCNDVRLVRKAVGGGGSFLSALFGGRKKTDRGAERLVSWVANGGPSTIKSFGGFERWYARMNDGLGAFIEKEMKLGVVLNGRLYSHTVPDSSRYWKPVGEIEQLPLSERDEAIEEWVWGRRLHGIDHRTGKSIPKPEPAEVDRMLSALGVRGIVNGHSLMQSLVPVRWYDGKVVNIDFHGHPLSDPWLDEYED